LIPSWADCQATAGRDATAPWTVKSQTLANAFVKYDFEREGWLNGVSLKVGANNLANKRPPVADDVFGFPSGVYQANPRYWYINVGKTF